MSEQYPEGYYWIQVGDCEPEPALIRDGAAFATGSALPLDLDLIEVLDPIKRSSPQQQWGRRGSCIYGEDKGPGTAPLIAEFHGTGVTPDAIDRIVEAHNKTA